RAGGARAGSAEAGGAEAGGAEADGDEASGAGAGGAAAGSAGAGGAGVGGIDAANGTPWTEVRKWMTGEFCPRSVLQRLEQELYNLKLKGTDIYG
nr:putative retrotransposon Gag domain-containing protein [Tanacetum cinerariifolium]